MSDHAPAHDGRREALAVAGVYALVAALWVIGSDLFLGPPVPAGETRMDLIKGLSFVTVTAGVLYAWVWRQTHRHARLAEQYRSLAEGAPDLVFRVRLRPEVRFEYVNRASHELTGYGPDDYYADPEGMLDTVHPEDRGRLQRVLDRPETAKGEIELRWRHRDGRTVWTENRFTPVRDEDGAVVGLQGIARDVTSRKEAQHRNELLATAVEAAGEAVIITNRSGHIEYVNTAFTEITGYRPEEVLGETPRLLKSGRQPDTFYHELWNTISAGRTFRGEMVNRRRDGRLYDQHCTITPVTDGDGRVTHFVAVARDVTVEREMDERIRIARKMQAVGQLAAGVAHDFRNLLNVIQINAGALSRRERGAEPEPTTLSPDDATRIDEVRDAADRGVALVGKLLTVGRRDELSLAPTDLGRVVEGLRASFRAVLPDPVTLDLTANPSLPPILADTTALEQILLNLVTNARDALDGAGRVRVAVDEAPARPSGHRGHEPQAARGRYVRLAVEDSGKGMDEETLRRIFEPFFTTKPEGRGTGLGLATVRSLVERHGGIVSAESRPGGGTTFELFFPTAPEATLPGDGAAADAIAEWDALPRGGEAILLVEDEDSLRSAGTRVLKGLGYTVSAARNGEEALDWLTAGDREVDLVVTDLVMPNMDGMTLFERSRERGWGVPFLFMSGYGSEDLSWYPNPDRLRLILEKPWTVEELAHRVRDALDG